MRLRLPLFLILFIGISIAIPHLAHAAIPYWGPIIPPGISASGADSQTCALGWSGLIIIANNIVSLAITVAIAFIAPIMFGYAGFLYVVNPVNPSGRSHANSIMLNTVVGIVIALAGWLIVSAVMGVLYDAGTVGTSWSSLITSGGQDPCIPLAASLSQSPGATSSGSGLASSGAGCPGNLVCSGGACVTDPQLDNGSGALGQPCQPTSNNCASGLVCDNTDMCNTLANANTTQIPSCVSSSGGTCQASASGPCTVPNLAQSCFSTNASQASIVCQNESGGNPNIGSKVDVTSDGHSYSIGLFQINLTNSYSQTVDGQNCSAAFSAPCQNSGGYSNVSSSGQCSSRVVNLQLYNDCVASAEVPANNLQQACSLSASGSSWGPWRNTANGCGL